MSAVGIIFTLVFIAIVFAAVLAVIVRNLLYICQPNEVLIFIGGRSGSAQRQLGYRVIKGGRAVRVPLFEVVDRMDLTNMPIEVAVTGAYSKGGIPLNVHGIANVKIAGEQPVLDNAIERFLGVPRNHIMEMARETLEGNLRGVLATLTPEEVNEDKIKFAQSLLTEAEDDLRAMGLELDTLKIQDVSDEVGYLAGIGRKQSAEVQKNAVIAEARSKAEAAIRAAQNRQDTQISEIQAQLGILRADVGRRMVDAETRASLRPRARSRRASPAPRRTWAFSAPASSRCVAGCRPMSSNRPARPAPPTRRRPRARRPASSSKGARAPRRSRSSRKPGGPWGRARVTCSSCRRSMRW